MKFLFIASIFFIGLSYSASNTLPPLVMIELQKGSIEYGDNNNNSNYLKAIEHYEMVLGMLDNRINNSNGQSKNTVKSGDKGYSYNTVLSGYKAEDFIEIKYNANLHIGKSYIGLCQRYDPEQSNLTHCESAIPYLKKAVVFLSQTKYTNKKYTDVRYHLGFAYMILRDYENAEIELQEANNINNKEGRVITALGVRHSYYAQGIAFDSNVFQQELNQSKIKFERALELHPENPAFINNVGEINFQLNHYKKAIKYYDEALFINPVDPDFYHNRGLAYLKLQQNIKACKDFKIANDLSPRSNKIRVIYQQLISESICN